MTGPLELDRLPTRSLLVFRLLHDYPVLKRPWRAFLAKANWIVLAEKFRLLDTER